MKSKLLTMIVLGLILTPSFSQNISINSRSKGITVTSKDYRLTTNKYGNTGRISLGSGNNKINININQRRNGKPSININLRQKNQRSRSF